MKPPKHKLPSNRFLLSTRRGKQFNTIVLRDKDPLTGAARDDLLIAREDAELIGLHDGQAIVIRSDHGQMRGRARLAPIRPGNVQAFFPEANVLIGATEHDGGSGIPDYNAIVEVAPLKAEPAATDTSTLWT